MSEADELPVESIRDAIEFVLDMARALNEHDPTLPIPATVRPYLTSPNYRPTPRR